MQTRGIPIVVPVLVVVGVCRSKEEKKRRGEERVQRQRQ